MTGIVNQALNTDTIVVTRGGKSFTMTLAQLVALASGGASDFDTLTDTPASKSGQALKLLQINAGETDLEYVAPAALDGLQFIAKASADDTQPDITFALPAGFEQMYFVLKNFTANDDDEHFKYRLSNDGGTTHRSGATDYNNTTGGRSGSSQLTNNFQATEIRSHDPGANTQVGNAAGESFGALVWVNSYAEAGLKTQMAVRAFWINASGNSAFSHLMGFVETAEANDSIEFSFQSGNNIVTGDAYQFGLKIN